MLAAPGASSLAILGTGEQASRHLEAMIAVRPITEVRVCSRSLEKAERFALKHSPFYPVPISPIERVPDAVAGAEIVCTVTHADEPILFGEWIAAGTHINAVGSSIPNTAELDTALVAKARFFVDFRESAHCQAGEYLRALQSGAIGGDHIQAEIGEVAAWRRPGRRDPVEITIYKSLGIAA